MIRAKRLGAVATVRWALGAALFFGSARPRSAVLAAEDRLVEEVAGGHVDWRAGRVRAGAGSAGDHRLPSPEAARPGAVRRARARAEESLRQVLAHLPVTQKLADEARGRALAAADQQVEYQSDGGAWVTLEVPFGPWIDAASKSSPASDKAASNPWREPIVIAVPRMRPVAGPVAEDKLRRVVMWRARYREGYPGPEAHALAAVLTEAGSLKLVEKGAEWPADLAQREVLIYVKAVPR